MLLINYCFNICVYVCLFVVIEKVYVNFCNIGLNLVKKFLYFFLILCLNCNLLINCVFLNKEVFFE